MNDIVAHNHQLQQVTYTVLTFFLAFFILLVTILLFMYMTRKKILHRQMTMQRAVVNAVINTQEAERNRISRDLHDDISSKLNAVSMNTYLLGSEKLSPQDRSELSAATFNACQQLIESTRRISHDLMPLTLENIGLHLAIKELCLEFSRAGMVQIHYKNPQEQTFFSHLTKEQEIHLFRILQELLNNSIKHGKATEISIVCRKLEKGRLYEYTDNGKGIRQEDIDNATGIGLNNIHSRADILNGKVQIDSKQQTGFHFNLTIPYDK